MKYTDFLAGASCFALVGCTHGAISDKDPILKLDNKTKRPVNVVLINLDDSGYADWSFKGAVGYDTPNVDYIANHGTHFTNYYSAQPISGASRSALITGCYSNRVGLTMAPMNGSPFGLAEEEETIGELLQENGYATALVGKWHIGDAEPFLPPHHGFDEWLGLPYSNDMWPNHPTMDFPRLPLYDGLEIKKYIDTDEDMSELTTMYTERAVEFISKNAKAGKPFFLYLAHAMPHVPLAVSDKFKGKSKAGLFGDVMMELDWSIGQVRQALEDSGVERNTLLIITSDNGPWCNYGNHAGSTGGYREGKSTTFNGGLKTPLIMYMPGHIKSGAICNELISSIDFLPTICAITGSKQPKLKIDGVDFTPYFTGQTSEPARKYLCFYFNFNSLEAVTDGQYKLIFPHVYNSYEVYAPGMDGQPGRVAWKMITETELYDLRQDPGERRNVIDLFPEKAAELQAIAEEMRADLGDDLTGAIGTGRRKQGRLPGTPEDAGMYGFQAAQGSKGSYSKQK